MYFVCRVGGRRYARFAAARARLAGISPVVTPPAPAGWPFRRDILPDIETATPATILIEDVHLAFPAGQTAGTRLVLTQSTYQLQRWLDRLDTVPGLSIVAHASKRGLTRGAPDAFARRGPWHRIAVEELPGDDEEETAMNGTGLASAFAQTPGERLETFRAASARDPENAALHLGVASTLMELDDLQPAQDALERASSLAPDWEAVWFEYGKLWLRADDLERAAERFSAAVRLMPSFSAAASNLGAALAEIDRPDEAIAALEQALRSDPDGYPILNNLAVIYREQGRLDEAIEAGRRVIALAPEFVFGFYNLAHALFLSGRFDESRDVYADAHGRDPQKNPVQAARLAIVRAATGDGARATSEMRDVLGRVPPDVRERIVEEASATLDALTTLPHAPRAAIGEVQRVLERG
jgi:tetratricopeptide (TPR) repeat protein